MRKPILALISIGLAGCWPDAGVLDEGRHYVNSRFHFAVDLPREGERIFSDNGDGVIVRWSDSAQMSFSGSHNALDWEDAAALAASVHPDLPMRPVRVAGHAAVDVARGETSRSIYIVDDGFCYTLAVDGGDPAAFRRARDSFRVLRPRAIRGR